MGPPERWISSRGHELMGSRAHDLMARSNGWISSCGLMTSWRDPTGGSRHEPMSSRAHVLMTSWRDPTGGSRHEPMSSWAHGLMTSWRDPTGGARECRIDVLRNENTHELQRVELVSTELSI